jgi:hypothetical protein
LRPLLTDSLEGTMRWGLTDGHSWRLDGGKRGEALKTPVH